MLLAFSGVRTVRDLEHCYGDANMTQLIAFNVGYTTQDIAMTIKIGLAGTLLTSLIVVPPWPFFKKNPFKWLPVGTGLETSTT